MKRACRLHILLAAAITLAFHGVEASAQATEKLTTLEMVGRYAELAKLAERRLAEQGQPSTSVVAPLCRAYSKLKEYRKLAVCLNQLEQQVHAGDTTIVTDRADISNSDATPLANMLRAEASIELGDYAKAIDEARIAFERIQDRMPFGIWPAKTYRMSLIETLGLAYALSGDRENALIQIKRLEDFPIGFLGWGSMPSVRDNAIARIHAALGNYAEALRFLKDEGAIVKSAYFLNNIAWGFSGSDVVETYIVLPKLLLRSKCLLETGDLVGARTYLDVVLRNARLDDFGEIQWIALYERGRVAEKEGPAGAALPFYLKAVEAIERQRASISTEANKIGFVGDKQVVYARLIAVLIEQGRAVEAFDYIERSKSRALVDMLASKKDFAAPDPAQAGLMLAQLDAADLNARIQDESAKPEARTTGARNLQVARETLQSAAPELSTLVTVSSVPSAELKALVGPDETLVEYYYQGTDLYAFLLDRERLLALRLDATQLASQVQSLRKTLEDTESQAWQQSARGLYQRLWQPLEKLITSKNVIVVAHGAMHYLPFAALQDAEGKFLLDRHSLRFLPSASVLKFLHPVLQNKDGGLLALGNPDLDDPRLDLAFAEGEAKLVASLYPSSRVLVRKDASESNFKKAGSVFSRIHFASHGKFQADEPLKSGLYLAKDADNDGVLTVGELYSMNLEADLVTLSACETGLGKISNGDDVVGLTRGFLYAGSRSIVASLWSVDDKATATLMQAFYANLASMNKREALRQAQIKAREAFPHPFFWAAFQLTGRAE
jgi:CHAT domain-containing protein